MDRVKRSLFLDPIDEVAANNLSDSQWIPNCDQDCDDQHDMAILENLIFPNEERSYNALDTQTSRKLKQAIREIFSDDSSNESHQIRIECSHCNEIFSSAEFQCHVCQYDANHQLIPIISEGEEESEFSKFATCYRNLLQKNQSSIADLLNTKKTKSGEGVQCTKCCRKFVNENGLMRHYEKHIGELMEESPIENSEVVEPAILCLICGAVFGESGEVWNHLQSCHIEVRDTKAYLKIPANLPDGNDSVAVTSNQPSTSKENNETVEMVLVSKVFQCEFCDLTFGGAEMLLFHEAKHDPSAAFSCNTCELSDLSLKDILLHRREECISFHDVRNQLRNFPHVWVCNICESEFRGLEQLLQHRYEELHFFPRISIRSNTLQFSCERCSEVFPTATELVDHHNEKYQKKSNPGATLGSTSDRIERSTALPRKGGIHQTSTRPRQYLCEVCGKSYTQSSHLWQHLRFHQGIKPFGCTVEGCDRRFTIRPDLNDHIRKCHTGERPYLCTICDKRFLTGSVFYQHRLIHRGERRYGCEECGKRFYRADALKNHERIHTGEKPHTCHECGKNFRQRGDRDKHFKSRHPNAVAVISPRKERVKSFGRGRVKNNTSLYCSMPPTSVSNV